MRELDWKKRKKEKKKPRDQNKEKWEETIKIARVKRISFILLCGLRCHRVSTCNENDPWELSQQQNPRNSPFNKQLTKSWSDFIKDHRRLHYMEGVDEKKRVGRPDIYPSTEHLLPSSINNLYYI